MKDSKQYAQRIKDAFRSFKRKDAKVRPPSFDKPLDALVYAVIAEHASRSETTRILKAFEGHFVDTNDLRVSRSEEVLEVIGTNAPWARKVAKALPRALNALFNLYDGLTVAPLMDVGKRQARKTLAELEGVSRFAADYFVLVVLGGHAIPLTEGMLSYLRSNELVHPDADDEDITGFLERQISASEAYAFYRLLRRAAETSTKPGPTRKKKK